MGSLLLFTPLSPLSPLSPFRRHAITLPQTQAQTQLQLLPLRLIALLCSFPHVRFVMLSVISPPRAGAGAVWSMRTRMRTRWAVVATTPMGVIDLTTCSCSSSTPAGGDSSTAPPVATTPSSVLRTRPQMPLPFPSRPTPLPPRCSSTRAALGLSSPASRPTRRGAMPVSSRTGGEAVAVAVAVAVAAPRNTIHSTSRYSTPPVCLSTAERERALTYIIYIPIML